MIAKLVQSVLLRIWVFVIGVPKFSSEEPDMAVLLRHRFPIADKNDEEGIVSAIEWAYPPSQFFPGFTYGTNEIPDSFDFAYFTPSRVDDIESELVKLRPPENADVWTAVAIDTNGPTTKFMTGIWLDGGLSNDRGGTLTHSNGLFRFSDECGGGDMDCWRKLKLQWIRKE